MEKYHYNDLLKVFDPETRTRIVNEVERRVEEAIIQEKKNLEERKYRLRKLLSTEEQKMSDRAITLRNSKEESRYDKMRRKIMEIETKRERERQELVEMKRKQQKFLNCEEIRSVLSKQQEAAIKKDQLWQINEKLILSAEKAKEDQYYHQLILQNMQDAVRLEEETAKAKWQNQVKLKNGYLQQIEQKNRTKEEEIRQREKEKLEIEQLLQKNKENEEKELRDRRTRMEELTIEWKRLTEREEAVRQQRCKEESSMEEEIEWIGSNHKGIDKITLMRELDCYRDWLAELKAKRKLEEEKFDEKLQELMNQRENKRMIEGKKLQLAREELTRSVLKGREDQMKEKQEIEKRQKELNASERQQVLQEIDKYQTELEKQKIEETERKKIYAQQLKNQIKEREEIKIREKEEKEKEKNIAIAEEVRLKRDFEEMILNPPAWDKHPLQGVQGNKYLAHTRTTAAAVGANCGAKCVFNKVKFYTGCSNQTD